MAATFTGRPGQNALAFTQHLVDIRNSGAVCMNQWRMLHLAAEVLEVERKGGGGGGATVDGLSVRR
jgi:hypothetical protein